ncbi:hypothetical protein BKA70DRAFT_1265218 [Coprinopsis sp. MPI-PUGE-AT-0042]|nr:hypothetical protein BKA70DRAFT_1265218 [Coprinopsis sp. MPI-PUGE-AT-0042]
MTMGSTLSFFTEMFPPASKFSVEDIPDLSGKVMIVTGANAGIGKETAKALLKKNAKVYMAARSQEKAESTIQELKEETGKEGIFLKLDLADLKSVKSAAEEFSRKEDRLHVLFNNGGVMVPPIEDVTAQGYDLQFGTNVIGHFYLTKLLLPVLVSTAKATGSKTRVVHTSSSGSLNAKIMDFNTFKDGPVRQKLRPWGLYFQSKLGNVIVANEFARRYGKDGVVSCSLNPGNLETDLLRHAGTMAKLAGKLILYPAPMGALTQLWAGTTDAGLDLNGKYLIPWARVGTPNPLGNDVKLGGILWKWLEDQVEGI